MVYGRHVDAGDDDDDDDDGDGRMPFRLDDCWRGWMRGLFDAGCWLGEQRWTRAWPDRPANFARALGRACLRKDVAAVIDSPTRANAGREARFAPTAKMAVKANIHF